MEQVSHPLTVTILGCGSSAGVPRLGGADGSGDWGACDPANPKNRRRRCSLLLRRGDTAVLVDTSPDMREQLLAARVTKLDAVLMTHPHADQTNGIDDLRPLTFIMRKRVEMYADTESLEHLMRQFSYCFVTPLGTEYPPIITGHAIPEPFSPFDLDRGRAALPLAPDACQCRDSFVMDRTGQTSPRDHHQHAHRYRLRQARCRASGRRRTRL